jgi:glycosyltransferase involved in cell wall biosynthesis
MRRGYDTDPQVCVIGRSDFRSGVGGITNAALELLSRSIPVCLFPTRESRDALGPFVTLPSGRMIPVVDQPNGRTAYFFTDVLWNGAADRNFHHVPEDGFRVAHMAFDSDQLPPEWVRILNDRFDLALFTGAHLEEVALISGVKIPVGTLPLGLPIESLLSRRQTPPRPGRTRFGTISAFHHRKGLEVLIEAFAETFADSEDVELVLHSNFAIGENLDRIKTKVSSLAPGRVTVSHGDLSNTAKDDLIDSFDVYVSASSGEGYSIGPREALALGKSLVLTDVPAHRDLGGIPGVFMVEANGRAPARYLEIDNRVFGTQMAFSAAALGRAMRTSHEFVHSDESANTTRDRKTRAAEFSLTSLEADYRRVIDPDAPGGERWTAGSSFTHLPETGVALAREHAGRLGSRVRRRKIIVRGHDGGFFSLFNIFLSNLVWSLQESSPPMVIPDWNVTRLTERLNGNLPLSYCYSKPEDGNMWLGLFEPLYDLTADEMNDPELLYRDAEFPVTPFNEHREPLLTYNNAFELYRAPWFARFRRQYHRVVRDRVHLRKELQNEIDRFSERLSGKFVVAVHVKHPSHAVEQPSQRRILESSDAWGVFVATDQDRVVQRFGEEFGDNVITFDDVTRISAETDSRYDSLRTEDRLRDGHQLQHQIATDPDRWSLRFAWEIWRDAEAMAACNVLLHSVSNVATAVSYLNERIEMIYCDPDV